MTEGGKQLECTIIYCNTTTTTTTTVTKYVVEQREVNNRDSLQKSTCIYQTMGYLLSIIATVLARCK